MKHHPPPMTDPLGRCWQQPRRESVLVDDNCAVMSKSDFKSLLAYDRSLPTGASTGKMWRAGDLLCWYGEIHGDLIEVQRRKVEFLKEETDAS